MKNRSHHSNAPQTRTRSRGPFVLLVGLVLASAGIGAWRIRARRRLAPKPPIVAVDTAKAADRAEGPSGPVPKTWIRARAQVAEVMKTSPERLSPHARVERFDAYAFSRSPVDYLSKVEPARCFQTAKPGADVPVLSAQSPMRTQISWEDVALLLIKTAPNAPVTFTAFGGGYFVENGVGTVSVEADARGLATVHFTAERGINGDVSVIAGSPLASGNERFNIRVGTQTARL